MPPRKTPPLAYCEYVVPDKKGSIAVSTARRKLMESVKRLHPIMLETLSRDVFPAYVELAGSGFDIERILWNDRLSPSAMLPDDDKPQSQVETKAGRLELVHYRNSRLKAALLTWASQFHAEENWFLDEVLRTLHGWHIAPDWKKQLRWNFTGGVINTLAMGNRFQFRCEGWEMQLLTWSAYSQSLRKRFEQKLAKYEAASRKLAESQGLIRAPRKYSPSNLDWFVLYQFAGVTSTQIVRRVARQDPNIDESTVLKGVKAAAKLLGWERLRSIPTQTNRKIQ